MKPDRIPPENKDPFKKKYELEEFGKNELKKFKDRDDKVVREWFGPRNVHDDESLNDEQKTDKYFEYLQHRKEIFAELENKYGLSIPHSEYVIFENKQGRRGIYVITDKVEGEDMHVVENADEKDKELILSESEKMVTALTDYLMDSYKEGKGIINDIYRPDQYIFGEYKGKKGLHMIDVDPYMDGAPESKISMDQHDIYTCIREIMNFIMHTERICGTTLENLREKVKATKELFDEIDYDKMYEDAKEMYFIHNDVDEELKKEAMVIRKKTL